MKYLLFCLAILFASCDPSGFVEYKIKNSSSYKIKINYTINNLKKLDSTLILNNASEMRIYANGGLGATWDKLKIPYDTLTAFKINGIFKNDSIKSLTNFNNANRWALYKNGKNDGKYTLEITDADF